MTGQVGHIQPGIRKCVPLPDSGVCVPKARTAGFSLVCPSTGLMSDPDDFETWLSGSIEDAFKLARSYAAEQRRIVQSGADRADLLQAA